MNKVLIDSFASPNVNLSEVEKLKDSHENELKLIQVNIDKFESEIDQIEAIEFSSDFDFQKTHFGIIKSSALFENKKEESIDDNDDDEESSSIVSHKANGKVNTVNDDSDMELETTEIARHAENGTAEIPTNKFANIDQNQNESVQDEVDDQDVIILNIHEKRHAISKEQIDRPKNQLISCSFDGSIKSWNLSTGHCIKTYTGFTKDLQCIEILSSNRFVCGYVNSTIINWNIESGECLKMAGHTHEVCCLKSLGNNLLASGSKKEIRIWNIETGVCIKELLGIQTKFFIKITIYCQS